MKKNQCSALVDDDNEEEEIEDIYIGTTAAQQKEEENKKKTSHDIEKITIIELDAVIKKMQEKLKIEMKQT